jgi:hypothetical protein
MKSKNKAYKEKQRKAAAIKAGIKVGPEPTGKYAKDTPDYAIEDLMRQGLTREEAVELSQRLLKIRTISIDYGDDVCCQMCGRKNYPGQKDGKKLQWSVERSLFLVDPSLTQVPRPHKSMILCEACLKEEIEKTYHANGTYAICNDGSCTESLEDSGMVMSMNIDTLDGAFAWIKRKYERDSEYYSIKTGMEVAQWLQNLWKSHLLYANGIMCHDKCYGMMCEHLGIPFNAEEYAIAAELQIKDFTPVGNGTYATDTGKG